MMISRLIIMAIMLTVLIYTIVGCSAEINTGNSLFSFYPEKPEAGKKLVVVFDSDHEQSRFEVGDPLFVTVRVSTVDSVYLLRTPIDANESQSGIYTAELTVPSNAVYLSFEVGLKENILNVNSIGTPVFNSGKPACGASFYLILYSKSFGEAKKYYLDDKERYPDSRERVVALWQKLLDSNMSTDRILAAADSLYADIQSNQLTGDSGLCNAIACVLAYEHNHNYKKLVSILATIAQYLDSRSGKMSIMMEYVLVGVWYRMMKKYIDYQQYDDDMLSQFVVRMCNIAVKDRSLGLLSSISQFSYTSGASKIPLVDNTVRRHEIYKYTKNLVFSISEGGFLGDWSALCEIIQDSYKRGEYAYCRDAVLALNTYLDVSLLWVRDDKSRSVSVAPAYGVESNLRLILANSYLHLGDTANAVKLHSWLAHRDPNEEFLRYAIVQASISMAMCYCRKKI